MQAQHASRLAGQPYTLPWWQAKTIPHPSPSPHPHLSTGAHRASGHDGDPPWTSPVLTLAALSTYSMTNMAAKSKRYKEQIFMLTPQKNSYERGALIQFWEDSNCLRVIQRWQTPLQLLESSSLNIYLDNGIFAFSCSLLWISIFIILGFWCVSSNNITLNSILALSWDRFTVNQHKISTIINVIFLLIMRSFEFMIFKNDYQHLSSYHVTVSTNNSTISMLITIFKSDILSSEHDLHHPVITTF